MRTAAKVFFVATAAVGCLALATMGTNCGGSNGERPSGSGGTPSVGGSNQGGSTDPGAGGATGAGGTTGACSYSTPLLNCAAALTPANGSSGGVTDFTDWKMSAGKWGSCTGLHGSIFDYADSPKSSMKATVDGPPFALHLKGSVGSGSYAGGGLGFDSCVTVPSTFTQIQFTVTGSSPGCDLELQIQTFDQRPTTPAPGGGCTANCYGFPVAKKVAVLPATAAVTTVPLANFSNWATAANQVVGLQWQFTGTQIDPDAGAGCPIDVTITDVKFQ